MIANLDDISLKKIILESRSRSENFEKARDLLKERFYSKIINSLPIMGIREAKGEEIARAIFDHLPQVLADFRGGKPLQNFFDEYARKRARGSWPGCLCHGYFRWCGRSISDHLRKFRYHQILPIWGWSYKER